MAEKKKYRRAKKNDLLTPNVAEDAELQTPAAELSAQEQRARDAVAELCRDLFGENAKKMSAVAVAQETAEPPVQAPVSVKEVPDDEESAIIPAIVENADQPFDPYGDPELKMLADLEEEPDELLTLKEQMESSNEDFRLLLELEYEKELGDAIGFERIRAYHERALNGKKAVRRRNESASGEYERADEDVEIAIRHRYRKTRSRWILRLALSAVLFMLLLIYENGEWMAELFGGPLDGAKYPVPYILVGLQLLVFDAALCYRPLWEGVRRILRFSPVDHSAHVGVLLITFCYHIALLFVQHTESPTLFLSPAAFCLVVLAASELLNSYRELNAFEVLATRKQKYALLPRVSVGSVEESARARLHNDAAHGSTCYLRPVGFVRNYFANTARHASRHRNLGAHFVLILGLGAALGLFAFAGGASGARVLGFVLLSSLLCAPVISAVLTSIPLFFSSAFCLKREGAIIGESPLEKSNTVDTLVLPDNELFLSMEREHFRLLELCDAHRVTVLLRALLEKIQSPLAAAFGVDSDSRLSVAELTLTHIGDEGVCAELPRLQCRVAFGTAEYMTARGMSFKPLTEGIERPMYVAVDDVVCAAFYVRYTLCPDLEPLLVELHCAKLRVVVRSKDPCVREDVFAQLFEENVGQLTVQKPSANELDLRTERVDATVVALRSCKELARTVIVCRRVSRVGMWGKALQLISALSGAALALLLAFFGRLMPGALVTLWILFWCGGYTMLSYLYLRRPSEDI